MNMGLTAPDATKLLDDFAVEIIDELQRLLKAKGVEMSERGYEKLCDELRYSLKIKVE